MIEAPAEVARLWVQALNRIGTLASHEVRGAINGVAVSLEVVRSRCLRPASVLADVASFAETASDQLAGVTTMADALLYLVRPGAEREDVGATVRRLTVLLDAAARSRGGTLDLEAAEDDGDTRTSAGSEVTRLVLASALLAAVNEGEAASCRVTTGANVQVRVRRAGQEAPRVDEAVARAAAEGGIEVRYEAGEVILAFPAPRSADRSL